MAMAIYASDWSSRHDVPTHFLSHNLETHVERTLKHHMLQRVSTHYNYILTYMLIRTDY
jgi:hypothetical protein